jgi:predicted RNA binding protein YcfA (HicA-like mRNA interferase family)
VTRLPGVKPRKAMRALERAGFSLAHVRGSHYYYTHPNDPTLLVCVPYHTRDLKRGTLASIIQAAQLTTEEFLKLL